MNKQTLKALKGSIKKWEAIVDGSGIDEGDENCPLCKLFYWEKECIGCPVMEETGKECCEGSPYNKWSQSQMMRNEAWVADTPLRKQLAREELKFLKSLLP